MSYDAKVFNVMVASPGDVLAERAVFREVIHEWNAVHSEARKVVLMPVGWETHSSPEMGSGPQDIINQQVLHSCDLLVAIFWTKAGTPTTEYASGTIEEIERHIAAGRLAMLYFSSTPAAMDDVDYEQFQTLKAFKASCRVRGLYESFESLAEFRNKFSRQLQQKLNAHDMFKLAQAQLPNTNLGPLDTFPAATQTLTLEARTLLKEASQDPQGQIIYIHMLGGAALQSNGKSFIETEEPRVIARWEAGLNQLKREGLIIPRGKGEIFQITAKGYDFADKIDS